MFLKREEMEVMEVGDSIAALKFDVVSKSNFWPDSDTFEIGSRFPHHGLWSLEGCEASDGSPENTIGQVCSDCHDAAMKT